MYNGFVTSLNYSKINNNDDVHCKLCDLVMETVEMTTDHWTLYTYHISQFLSPLSTSTTNKAHFICQICHQP